MQREFLHQNMNATCQVEDLKQKLQTTTDAATAEKESYVFKNSRLRV